jgi:lipopolysaccharide biosynthesis regulator YciM
MESHSPDSLEVARQEFESELKLNPSDAAAEYQIGQILLAQQKAEEAGKRYERALALSPKFPEALLALGKVRLDEKRFSESIALLQQAAALLPKSEAAHYALMIAYRNSGKTEERVAAINGLAMASGLAVALSADISVVGENVKLNDGHLRGGMGEKTRRGVHADDGVGGRLAVGLVQLFVGVALVLLRLVLGVGLRLRGLGLLQFPVAE